MRVWIVFALTGGDRRVVLGVFARLDAAYAAAHGAEAWVDGPFTVTQ